MLKLPSLKSPSSFGVYIHWPFCVSKCPYCDFNSHVRSQGIDEDAFAEAFEQELTTWSRQLDYTSVTSIFFGGGTPSLMSVRTCARILNRISQLWTLNENVEITLEANPNSVDQTHFEGYRDAGVNRISLGLQSLIPNALTFLGRKHSVEEGLRALELITRLFPRYSFDLIYGRPQQSWQEWKQELEKALTYVGDHISLYQLTIEPRTPFFTHHARGLFTLPNDEHARNLYNGTTDLCSAHGLIAYEVSNYAKPGGESRHNLTYWRYKDYLGIGPGAHSRVHNNEGFIACSTEKHPERWVERVRQNGHGCCEKTILSPYEQGLEYMLMGLRLSEGIDRDHLYALSGITLSEERIQTLKSEGLIRNCTTTHLALTPHGRLVLNAVIDFLWKTPT
jgi:oxygen-independent coproporphyrinogen-3 oxidase